MARNDTSGTQNFSEHVVDAAAMAAKSSVPVDLDRDGDGNIVFASFNDDAIARYENNGSGIFTKRTVDSTADGSSSG